MLLSIAFGLLISDILVVLNSDLISFVDEDYFKAWSTQLAKVILFDF
jgi:hypothetical protein